MNNSQMYELPHAGGIPYPETDRCYHYDRQYTTTGLTDGGEYKALRFNVRQDMLLLHWTIAYIELKGKLVKKEGGTAYADGSLITLTHNAIPKLTIENNIFPCTLSMFGCSKLNSIMPAEILVGEDAPSCALFKY